MTVIGALWSFRELGEMSPHKRLCLPIHFHLPDLSRYRRSGFGPISLLWSRGVARWFRWDLSVADSFVCPCLTSSALLPSPHPAHRTGRADLLHPARGED